MKKSILNMSWWSMLVCIGLSGLMTHVAAAFELRVIDWVQGRPGIPHPAVNGKRPCFRQSLKHQNAPTRWKYRWDINADGDFGDSGEHWRDAGKNSGSYYFNYATIDVQLPNALGDTTMYPKIEAKCNGWGENQVQSSIMPS